LESLSGKLQGDIERAEMDLATERNNNRHLAAQLATEKGNRKTFEDLYKDESKRARDLENKISNIRDTLRQ